MRECSNPAQLLNEIRKGNPAQMVVQVSKIRKHRDQHPLSWKESSGVVTVRSAFGRNFTMSRETFDKIKDCLVPTGVVQVPKDCKETCGKGGVAV